MFKITLIYFAIRAINGVLGLASLILLTRLMSAQQYGVYALGLATIGLIASVLFQWITVAVARFYSEYSNRPGALVNEAIRLHIYVGLAALSIVSVGVTMSFTYSFEPFLIVAISLGVIFTGIHNFCLQISNAKGASKHYGLLTVSRGAFALCSTIILVKLNFGGLGAVFGFALGNALSVTIFHWRQIKKIQQKSTEIRQKIIGYGLPLTLTYLSITLLDVSDRLLINWWFGLAAVGSYAAAYDLTQQIVGAVMNVFLLAAYPRVVAAWEEGGAPAARRAILPLSQAMLLAAPLLAGIFIGGASEISNIMLGEAIRKESAEIIPWIAFAITIGCFKSYYLDLAFQLTKETHIQIKITIFMAVINIGMNFILMPRFGVVGAAAATAMAFTIGAVLSWWFGRRIEIYPTTKLDILSVMLILMSIVFVMRIAWSEEFNKFERLIVPTVYGVLVYLVLLYITNLANTRNKFNTYIKNLKKVKS